MIPPQLHAKRVAYVVAMVNVFRNQDVVITYSIVWTESTNKTAHYVLLISSDVTTLNALMRTNVVTVSHTVMMEAMKRIAVSICA